jgi:hypothetical protein
VHLSICVVVNVRDILIFHLPHLSLSLYVQLCWNRVGQDDILAVAAECAPCKYNRAGSNLRYFYCFTTNNNSVRLLKKLQAFGSFNLLRNLPEFFQENLYGIFSGIFRNIFRKRPCSYLYYKYALNCDFVISIDFRSMWGTIMSKKNYKKFPQMDLNLPPSAS